MFKNIGRSLRVLAFVLAGLCFAAFAAFGALCLFSALEDGVNEALKIAGLQAAGISFALAILTPFLQLVTYGLGVLIDTQKEQAQDNKRIREILQASLADGLLSEDIARKSGAVMAKILPHLQAQAPVAATAAPVQRPVVQPIIPTPAVEEIVQEEAPAEDEIRVETIDEAQAEVQAPTPVKSAPAKAAPVKPAPVKPAPAKPIGAWRPLSDNEETF